MAEYTLEVDGYDVGDRLLEGVMFKVHLVESGGNLSIDKVVSPDNEYTKMINTGPFTDKIREQVQGAIDQLTNDAHSSGRTISDLLDEYELDYPDDYRMNALIEV